MYIDGNLIFSCQGPEGATGEPGPQGETGPQVQTFCFFKQFFLVIFKFQIYLLQGDRGGSGPKGSRGSQGEFVSYFLYPPLPCSISIIS